MDLFAAIAPSCGEATYVPLQDKDLFRFIYLLVELRLVEVAVHG